MDDYTCAGCHQGSNRTVMQYWGIRLDQNQDLRRGVQYPSMPLGGYRNTSGDTRPLTIRTFPSTTRTAVQIRTGTTTRSTAATATSTSPSRRTTTTTTATTRPRTCTTRPGMGCIDCHGSHDLHGGNGNDPEGPRILNRMEQGVAISCESCHGSGSTRSTPTTHRIGTTYFGSSTRRWGWTPRATCMRHVVKEADGHYYLYSKPDRERKHFIPPDARRRSRSTTRSCTPSRARASRSSFRDRLVRDGPRRTATPATGLGAAPDGRDGSHRLQRTPTTMRLRKPATPHGRTRAWAATSRASTTSSTATCSATSRARSIVFERATTRTSSTSPRCFSSSA